MRPRPALLRSAVVSLVATLFMVAPSVLTVSLSAKPKTPDLEKLLQQVRTRAPETPAFYGTPMSMAAAGDTIYFGGTTWDPVEMRWEALRDSVWTFESGVGSVINSDSTIKQVGLHALMEGWYGVDLTLPEQRQFFRRSMTCAIDGSWSMWAGLTQAEADSFGWKGGQGYGTVWTQSIGKTFDYSGSGEVILRFDYQVEAEDGFDFFHVLVDTTGNTAIRQLAPLVSYDGTASGTDSLVLVPGISLPDSGSIRVIFQAESDGAWDDEDGLYNSTCGHSAVDNIVLTGAIEDTSDFESGEDGWEFIRPPAYAEAGDWSDIHAVQELAIDPGLCQASFGDSALIFSDLTIAGGGHGFFQDNMAVSPWIDLTDPDVFGKPGKVLDFTGYLDLPLIEFVYFTVRVRWLPEDLPSPNNKVAAGGFYFAGGGGLGIQGCYTREDWGHFDLTSHIPPDAEQVQIGLGVINACRFFWNCPGGSNESPWFDDVRLAVSDGDIQQRFFVFDGDLPRDTFPEHDSQVDFINMAGRFDSSIRIREGILGDTLVVRTGDSYSQSRVDVVFRVFGGPGIDAGRLSAWLAGFVDEGDGWFSARMDTAEVGGMPAEDHWMTAFHEDDSNFTGTDEDLDPGDRYPGGQLARPANDIFPDDLFTPGTRVELYYRWSLVNLPGLISVLPDTIGGNYLELEVLPSSLDLDGGLSTNNRVLFVNQARGQAMRSGIEGALANLLPGGSANREGTRWDRFDLPAGDPMIPASSFFAGIEHDVHFLDRYDRIIWGFERGEMLRGDTPDAFRLLQWLECTGGGEGGENGCGRALYKTGEVFGGGSSAFYDAMGVEYFCGDLNTCAAEDFHETCIAVFGNVASTHFGQGSEWSMNTHGAADRLTPRASQGDAFHEPNLFYRLPIADPMATAAMSTIQLVRSGGEVTGYWKSVYEGIPVTRLGNDPDCIESPDGVEERLGAVLAWFEEPDPTPVTLLSFAAVRQERGVALAWKVAGDPSGFAGFHVYREVPDGARTRITDALLPPRAEYRLVDSEAPPGRVDYWLAEVARTGETSWHGPFAVEESTPLRFLVHQSYPNPFTGTANIRFELPEAAEVRIQVFSMGGRLVAYLSPGFRPPGIHQVTWDGRDDHGRPAADGIYLYRLITPTDAVTRKLVKTSESGRK